MTTAKLIYMRLTPPKSKLPNWKEKWGSNLSRHGRLTNIDHFISIVQGFKIYRRARYMEQITSYTYKQVLRFLGQNIIQDVP